MQDDMRRLEPTDPYLEQLPEQLVRHWKEHGLHSDADGLVRFCQPKEIVSFTKRGYPEKTKAVPFATTAFGDVLVWRDDQYVDLLRFSQGTVDVIASGFDFFLEDLHDPHYVESYFPVALYAEVKEKLGSISSDECYGYAPLLSLGGNGRITDLAVCKLKEYLELILQAEGK